MCETGPKPAPSYTDLEQRLAASESARREAEEKLGHADERASWSRVWTIIETLGIGGGGCPDHQIVHHVEELRSALASERAARERAEGERDEALRKLQKTVAKVAENRLDGYRALGQRALDNEIAAEGWRLKAVASEARADAAEARLAECDDELENASCPPMTNETIPERIARLAGLVSSTARDEQTALEGKVAAESRLAEAEAALRDVADFLEPIDTIKVAFGSPHRTDAATLIGKARIRLDVFLAGGKR